MVTAAVKNGPSLKGKGRMAARPRKKLTKRELAKPKGRFAAHIQALLDERGWDTNEAAWRFGVGEPTVRKWLRAESVPETLDLQRIGKALDIPGYPFPDYRQVLPPSV